MARVKRNAEKWHRITISSDRKEGDLLLVKGGKNGVRAYLWAGVNGQCVTFSGRKTLITLAQAILLECGAGKGE